MPDKPDLTFIKKLRDFMDHCERGGIRRFASPKDRPQAERDLRSLKEIVDYIEAKEN